MFNYYIDERLNFAKMIYIYRNENVETAEDQIKK